MFKKAICLLLMLPVCIFSETSSDSKGAKLTNHFWKAVQEKNSKKIDSLLSSDFQASSADGAISRKQELHFLKILPITDFEIFNVQSTKCDHRIVVSYDLKLINAAATPSTSYFHQLFVWIHHHGQWKLVSDTFIQYSPVA